MTEVDPTAAFIQAVTAGNPDAMNEFVQARNSEHAAPADPPVDPPADPPVEPPVNNTEVPAETPAEPVVPAAVPNYVKEIFGDDYNENITPELVRSTFSGFNQASARVGELEAELLRLKDVADLIKNPYPSERVARLAAAERTLKIGDSQVVDIVTTATAESLTKDPVTALAVAKVLAKPELLGKGVSFADIRASADEELGGYDPETPLTSTQKVKLAEAVYDITAKQGELKAAPIDIEAMLTQGRQLRQEQVDATIKELAVMTPDVVAGLKKEFADSGLPVVLDEAKVTPYVAQMLEGFARNGAKTKDVSPDMVRTYARYYAIEQAGGLQGIGKAYKAALEAGIKSAKEDAAKASHNGGTVARPAAPESKQIGDKTKAFVDQTLREINQPIPT